MFLLNGARIAATAETRTLDILLIATLAAILVQIAPLSSAAIAVLSPHAAALQQMLAITTSPVQRLSIDARLTRAGLATAASALLVFWSAREAFGRGGLRRCARLVAIAGCAVAIPALIQRTSAPGLLLWQWTPLDPGARPFGPFVNRNHFATWLLMATSLTAGYLLAHLRSHRFDEHTSRRLMLRDLMADGRALLLGGAVGVMLLAMVASLSRAALLGSGAALVFAVLVTRGRKRDASLSVGIAVLAVALVSALLVNREGLLARVEMSGGAAVGRRVIWAETIPVVNDFWLTGTGLGTYGTAMLQYQRTGTDTLFNQAHNEYLQLVSEGGMLLTIPIACALFVWVRIARRRIIGRDDHIEWTRIGAAAGLVGVAVQSLFETGLRMPANALLCAILAAIVVHETRQARLTPGSVATTAAHR